MPNDKILVERPPIPQAGRPPNHGDIPKPCQVSRMPKELTSCPQCDSQDIRFSHSTKILDFLATFLNRVPFRCRKCHLRFYRQY